MKFWRIKKILITVPDPIRDAPITDVCPLTDAFSVKKVIKNPKLAPWGTIGPLTDAFFENWKRPLWDQGL